MRGPVMPVCFEDVPCDAPVSGATLTFTRTDGLKARTVTRQTGFYRILLPPGRYSVTTSARTTFGFAPREVRVRTERDARLDFYISTGIQ
jgi:hypothetical protein